MKKSNQSERTKLAFPIGIMQAATALVMLLALGAASLARNASYCSTILLWEDAAAKSPAKARPHYNLGRYYAGERRSGEALREYRAAARIDPLDPVTHYNIGNALLLLGRIQEAVPEYRTALVLRPGYEDALHNFEVALRLEVDRAVAGRNRQAEAAARNNLGNLFFMRGEYGKSRQEYEAALRLLPRFGEASYNLGRVRIALLMTAK